MADIAKITLPNNNTYNIKDAAAVRKSGDTMTGPLIVQSELYADSTTTGSLVATGASRFLNGLQGDLTGTIDGHTIAKDVPANAVFTDTTYTAATATPLMDGTAAVGTSAKYAREDHRHPTDTSKVSVNANQGLTDTQKSNARNNIGLGNAALKTVETSFDLTSESTNLPTVSAVAGAINSAIAASDAMIFRGTLGVDGTTPILPNYYNVGDTYRVVTAGTYAGNVCQIGDLVIALVKRSGTGMLSSDWTVAQTNVDGAITSTGGTINGTLTVENQLNANSANVGNLVVNGDAIFTNGLRGDLIGNADTATFANKLIQDQITVKTGSERQAHITLQTLMTWLITTKEYIPSGINCYKYIPITWSYADNDILQVSINGAKYEIQLAGCILEYWGNASSYNNGSFRFRIHTSPTNSSFTLASGGYVKIPTSSVVEYFCNGSGYNPVWKIYSDQKFPFEYKRCLSFGGASGTYLKIGTFPVYDSNIVIDITMTGSNVYHGTLVIATQNVSGSSVGTHEIKVYNDPSGVIASRLRVVWASGYQRYEIYFQVVNYAKIMLHIKAFALPDVPFDLCISQSGTIPDSTSGLQPVNVGYNAGTGLSLNGTTFNHSNSITAGSVGTTTATSGTSIYIPFIQYDAQGHITSASGRTHTIDLSGYSNQNAFSNVKVGSTTVAADSTTDTLELAAGTNISLTPDATNDKITISATDTKNTAGSTDTSSKIFLIGATSQAANSQTYSDDQVYTTSGVLSVNSLSAGNYVAAYQGVRANTANSGIAGGVALYAADPAAYGITMRQTGTSSGQMGKHGFVQGDWATYLTFSGAVNRGFVFRFGGVNVASINGEGKAVFNNSVTVGGNVTNTSGCKMEYNTTTQSLDFVFA